MAKITQSRFLSQRLLLLLLLWLPATLAAQQAEPAASAPAAADPQAARAQTERLDAISDILDSRIQRREELRTAIAAAGGEAVDERAELSTLDDEITRLRTAFELLALGDVDLDIIDDSNTVYNWREEVVEIVAPLLESLKAVTERPRQKAELRESVALHTARMELAARALRSLDSLPIEQLDPQAVERINKLVEKWSGERRAFEQDLLVDTAQLERLESTSVPLGSALWPTLRQFALGRGLTLVLGVLAAIAAWLFMRFLWWIFSTRFISKEQRRHRTWFRLLSYSYFVVNLMVVLVVVIAVLYVREDLLMLALAVVIIAVSALGLRQFIPAYLREARLLINFGAVREGERLMYQGIPWQVMSLNLQTVLRNPALDGVLRLPLETVATLRSRPFRDTLWFPCKRKDYIFLPDGSFAQVLKLTPELVQLRVRGGMLKSFPTADFYALDIVNISRGESYGIAVTFGYGYELQALCLSSVAPVLKSAIEQALAKAGFAEHMLDLLVDFKAASSSSLDYLIYATVDSKAASSYYSIERVIQQTCVAVANEQGWSIPYPQMTIHSGRVAAG